MNFWLDFGIAVLIGLFCFSGYKRGAVYMAVNTAGTVAAVVLASVLASPVALPVYNWILKDNIINGLTGATSSIVKSEGAEMAKQTMAVMSNFTKNAFSFMGVDQNKLAKACHLIEPSCEKPVHHIAHGGNEYYNACIDKLLLQQEMQQRNYQN